MVKRIGIFGGSFNPIHIGHLVIAESACQEFDLEKVIFVPSGDTPHKDMHHIDKEARYDMVKEAIRGNPMFTISPVERDRSGPSYTVDTIHILQQEMGKDIEFYFICGTDALADLPTWKYNRELLEICHFICASRPGYEEKLKKSVACFGELGKEKIHFLKIPELEISSTILRDLLAHNKSARYFIPDAVIRFIKKNHLYEG
ncbi:nicotinate-nucleotide adenylyltransferase [Dialister sp.]|jgi:nicotinate-nucleotide adenylyltransferase|uniref:nicotinate-nucleotide adenylyltransferase n=1 Tax=Dialister sp. TaxID=1955814 RepID=UPI0025D762D1|nr:nicotinate-nucleotide adenylyltransferase [Dialister sp.]